EPHGLCVSHLHPYMTIAVVGDCVCPRTHRPLMPHIWDDSHTWPLMAQALRLISLFSADEVQGGALPIYVGPLGKHLHRRVSAVVAAAPLIRRRVTLQPQSNRGDSTCQYLAAANLQVRPRVRGACLSRT